jgi:hypothetical protein
LEAVRDDLVELGLLHAAPGPAGGDRVVLSRRGRLLAGDVTARILAAGDARLLAAGDARDVGGAAAGTRYT